MMSVIIYVILDKTNSIAYAIIVQKFLKLPVFLLVKILYLQVMEVNVPIVKEFVKLEAYVSNALNKYDLYVTSKIASSIKLFATKCVKDV